MLVLNNGRTPDRIIQYTYTVSHEVSANQESVIPSQYLAWICSVHTHIFLLKHFENADLNRQTRIVLILRPLGISIPKFIRIHAAQVEWQPIFSSCLHEAKIKHSRIAQTFKIAHSTSYLVCTLHMSGMLACILILNN